MHDGKVLLELVRDDIRNCEQIWDTSILLEEVEERTTPG
jgi:hypothetical protein